MEWWQSLVLGVVQGITEFLPISSSGHLVLVQDLLSVSGSHLLAFNVFVHVGTLMAVVVYFWADILTLTQTLFRKLGRLPVNEKDWIMLVALAVGTVPAALLGFFLGSVVESMLMYPVPVALALVFGSVLFMYAEWSHFRFPHSRPLTVRVGFLMGCFQTLALIPGISRSGATIAGGMLLGLTRYEAARFSFLLAIPIITGAGVKVGIDVISEPTAFSWGVVMTGAVSSFLVALFVIHAFLAFIRRYTLWPFVWYRIALALLILYKEFLV
jgi:undecaprenyl-diphosphatase